jgi:hypothetical protein
VTVPLAADLALLRDSRLSKIGSASYRWSKILGAGQLMVVFEIGKDVRIVFNFDSHYFTGRGPPNKFDFLPSLVPKQPATLFADWLYWRMNRQYASRLIGTADFIRTAYKGCTEVEPIESGSFELHFFQDYVLFERMFQTPKGAGEEWDDVLATRDQTIAMIEALIAKQQGEGLVGRFELRGEVLAYGTKAKEMFRELTGYWDEREYEERDDEDSDADDRDDDED